MSVLYFLILVLLLVSQSIGYLPAITVPSSGTTTSINPVRRLGFWVDERQMWSGSGLEWSPTTFFSNYFLTPPYPSTMLFATGPSQIQGYMNTKAINWLPKVAALADNYPNIQINVLVFINLTDPAQVTELQNFVGALKGHSSIYGFEYEREYFGNTIPENQQFCNIVISSGFNCIMDPSIASSFPTNPSLGYCEFPYFQYSDSVEACVSSGTGATEIGKGFGEYSAVETFPAQCTLPSNISIPANPPCNGWNRQIIQAIINDSLYVSVQNRMFTYIYAGYVTANSPLWNDSMLRGWVWTDPYYLLNYGLSINGEKLNVSISTSFTTSVSSSRTAISNSTQSRSTTGINSSSISTKINFKSTTSSSTNKLPIGGAAAFSYVAAIVIPALIACGYAVIIFNKKRKKPSLQAREK